MESEREFMGNIRFNYEKERKRVAAYDGSKCIGTCNYVTPGSSWIITHTEVDSAYGGRVSCPDCAYVEEQIKDNKSFRLIDIGEHIKYLKAFIRIRDNNPVFEDYFTK